MKPQIITTGSGEELVVLTRPEYDALLARAGHEDAEDRMMVRMTEAHRSARAADEVEYAPRWLTDGLLDGKSPILAAREQAGLSQIALAESVGLVVSEIEDLEAEQTAGSPDLIRRIAAATGVDAGWLGLDD